MALCPGILSFSTINTISEKLSLKSNFLFSFWIYKDILNVFSQKCIIMHLFGDDFTFYKNIHQKSSEVKRRGQLGIF